mmetsp:Transcript_105763/g.188141  ORF Transcript_105763/g.188141 Transcript_105763/m.188141 type:complete len:240 (+) Transcript_105763:925-1644(+)
MMLNCVAFPPLRFGSWMVWKVQVRWLSQQPSLDRCCLPCGRALHQCSHTTPLWALLVLQSLMLQWDFCRHHSFRSLMGRTQKLPSLTASLRRMTGPPRIARSLLVLCLVESWARSSRSKPASGVTSSVHATSTSLVGWPPTARLSHGQRCIPSWKARLWKLQRTRTRRKRSRGLAWQARKWMHRRSIRPSPSSSRTSPSILVAILQSQELQVAWQAPCRPWPRRAARCAPRWAVHRGAR